MSTRKLQRCWLFVLSEFHSNLFKSRDKIEEYTMSLENNTEYIVEDLILHDEKQYSIEPDEQIDQAR